MLALRISAVLASLVNLGLPMPLPQHDSSTGAVTEGSDSSALYYLMKYGYIQKDENENTAALMSAEGVKKAIKDFQVKFKIKYF